MSNLSVEARGGLERFVTAELMRCHRYVKAVDPDRGLDDVSFVVGRMPDSFLCWLDTELAVGGPLGVRRSDNGPYWYYFAAKYRKVLDGLMAHGLRLCYGNDIPQTERMLFAEACVAPNLAILLRFVADRYRLYDRLRREELSDE